MQPTADTLEARDTTQQGPDAQPERGEGATIDFQGTPVDDASLERIFSTILEDADRYRRKFASEWLALYNQYNGVVDDTSKAEWQSRLNIPKAKQAVDLSTARVMDSLFSNEDFFDIFPYIKQDDIKVDTAKKMIKWQLWKSNYREPLKTAIKDGFICGFGPLKVGFEEDDRPVTTVNQDPMTGQMQFAVTTETRKRLRLDPCIPTDVWLDPTGRNRFIIHRVKRSISDLWAMAQDQTDPATGAVVRPAVYDADKLRSVKPGSIDPEREVQNALIRRDTPYLNQDIGVDVYEFWGDLYDPRNGAVLYRNVVATFVNKRTVIRRPQANPYRHGLAPFVVFAPQLSPHQIYGFGLLGPGSMLQSALNRTVNIISDKHLLTMPMVQAVPGALRDPNEMAGDRPKVVPGKVWQIKDPDRPAFVPVQGFVPPSQEDFELLQFFSSAYDQTTGVNEFATGTPQSDNRKTKEEVQARTSATQQTFNDAAIHIEETALSPLIKMIYYLMVQFEQEYGDDNLLRQFGTDQQQIIIGLSTLSPEQRWQYMFLDAEFRVTGVSLAITQQERISRFANFKQMVSNDPYLNAIIDKQEELRWWIRNFNLPQSLVLQGADVIIQALQQGAISQILGPMMGGQPGQPGANQNNNQQAGAADARKAAQRSTAGPKSQEQQPQ